MSINPELKIYSPQAELESLFVIGIVGHSRAGKDTVANMLTAHEGFKRIALADGPREALMSLNGPTWELFKDIDESESWDNREMMKILGTECREDVGSTIHWTNHALIKIRYLAEYHPKPHRRFVIPDIRFPHEVIALSKVLASWGGRFESWSVTRPGCVARTGHTSETLVDSVPCDRGIHNSGTIDDLRLAVGRCFTRAERTIAS